MRTFIYLIGPVLALFAIVVSVVTGLKLGKVRSIVEMDKEFILHFRLLMETVTIARERNLPVEEWMTEAAARLAKNDARERNRP